MRRRAMKRAMILSAAVLSGWLGLVATSQAQVFVRAPFVRVTVGDGVYVRVPFVNLYIPGDGPVYYPPVYDPRVIYMPPPVVVQPMPPAQNGFPAPVPQPLPKAPIVDPNAPPQ